jgi:hypothetical protein
MAQYITPMELPRTETEILITKVSEMINLINALSTNVEQLSLREEATSITTLSALKQLDLILNNPGIKALMACSNGPDESKEPIQYAK